MKSSLVLPNAFSINKVLVRTFLSLFCAVLLGLSSYIKLPIVGTPVPITIQTFTLIVFAGLLGRGYSLQMVIWYLMLGFLGAPFFAEGSGFSYMYGATGGYLVGFLFAAILVGYLDLKNRGWFNGLLFYVFASLMIYIPGILQLKLVSGATWQGAFAMGFYPFIAWDILKSSLAFVGVKTTKKFL